MIRRLRRAYCWAFGHSWSRWEPWRDLGTFHAHTRRCARCPETETEFDA